MLIQSTAGATGDASQPLSVPALTIWIVWNDHHSRPALADLHPCGSSPDAPHTKITIEAQRGSSIEAWAQVILDLENGWLGRLECSEDLIELFGAANNVVAGVPQDLPHLLEFLNASPVVEAAQEDLERARRGDFLAGGPADEEEDADPDDKLAPTVELDEDGRLVLA
jgi:hypothetical protein